MAAVFTAAFFASAPALSAEEATAEETTAGLFSSGDGRVADITVSGLKRTKPFVVRRILNRFIGQSASDLDLDEVQASLRETGLFDDIDVSIDATDPANPLLVVSLDEKQSILPIPVFAATSDGLIAGLGLIDANAFGRNDKAIAVGLYRSAGWFGAFNYAKTPTDTAPFGWTATLSGSNGETKIEDEREDTVLAFDMTTFDLSFEVKRAFGRFVTAAVGVGFSERAVQGDMPEAGRALPLSVGLSVRDTEWDGVFLSETSAEAKAIYSLGLIGDSYPGIEGRVVYERSVFSGLRAFLRMGAFSAPEASLVYSEGPSAASVAILPTDFRSSSLGGISLGLEARIFRFGAGTVSALTAYQAAIASGEPTGQIFAQGPSFGIRLYLSKIAIPAVDIGAAYNAETGIWRGAFGIGMRF